ncbi:hypothetical protein FA13DRAFT_977806 [Coprinellus micaceus]|uniref:Uncharacterized protein n=1 Tax=Coprinellus micaceus TaxID=71717 RepID=A0A4Y7SZ32_COPMI|nr:hypothetical protein FA13DRAFT_977806 [Coprinellus micaceus]
MNAEDTTTSFRPRVQRVFRVAHPEAWCVPLTRRLRHRAPSYLTQRRAFFGSAASAPCHTRCPHRSFPIRATDKSASLPFEAVCRVGPAHSSQTQTHEPTRFPFSDGTCHTRERRSSHTNGATPLFDEYGMCALCSCPRCPPTAPFTAAPAQRPETEPS